MKVAQAPTIIGINPALGACMAPKDKELAVLQYAIDNSSMNPFAIFSPTGLPASLTSCTLTFSWKINHIVIER